MDVDDKTATTTTAAAAAAAANGPDVTEARRAQVSVVRELWVLREQARVHSAERGFLGRLTRLLDRSIAATTASLVSNPQHNDAAAQLSGSVTPSSSEAADNASAEWIRPQSVPVSSRMREAMAERDDTTERIARERPNLLVDQITSLRTQQMVTNMSPEFRARLEGEISQDEPLPLSRNYTQAELVEAQRNVSNALDSEFRNHLETVLVSRPPPRRTSANSRRQDREDQARSADMNLDEDDPEFETIPDDSLDAQYRRAMAGQHQHSTSNHGHASDTSRYVVSAVRELEREIAVLKNVMNASFDIQLDIQRSIRQEVAASMAAAVPPHPVSRTSPGKRADDDGCIPGGPAPMSIAHPHKQFKQGICVVCLEEPIDSLLYGCGHMCSCSPCGRSLLASGLPCPVCRAPIRDVVRVFTVRPTAMMQKSGDDVSSGVE